MKRKWSELSFEEQNQYIADNMITPTELEFLSFIDPEITS